MELDVLTEEESVELGDLLGGDSVFEAGDGGLAGQVIGTVKPSTAEEFECGVATELGVVVGVLIPRDEGEEALTEDGGEIVLDLGRVRGVG